MGQNTYWTNFKGSKKEMSSKLKGKIKSKPGSINTIPSAKMKVKAQALADREISKRKKEKEEKIAANRRNLLALKKRIDHVGYKVGYDDIKKTLITMKDSELKDEFTFSLIKLNDLRERLTDKIFREYLQEKNKIRRKYYDYYDGEEILMKKKSYKDFLREMAEHVRRFYFL